MTDDPLETILEALGGADEAAAERAFRTYEPVLRAVVRRRMPPQLRARFDSIDVVQSTWADLLEGLRSNRWRFTDPAQLRAFLVRSTGNRLIDRVRQHRSSLGHERASSDSSRGRGTPPQPPTASEVAQGNELWERMLESCPPAHRELLTLRREGLTTAEIADRVGLHEGSVRRILGELAARLAVQARESHAAPS